MPTPYKTNQMIDDFRANADAMADIYVGATPMTVQLSMHRNRAQSAEDENDISLREYEHG